jgi:hypothetical protein
LAALIAIGLLPGHAGAATVQEVEPNDDFAGANQLDIDETGAGDCTFETDFVWANLTEGVTYNFAYASPTVTRPADFTLHVHQPNGTEYQTHVVDADGNLSIVALETGKHAVGIQCRNPAGPWEVTFSTLGFAAPIQGDDEVEHNDKAAMATTVPVSNLATGSVLPPDDPVDFWAVDLAEGQAIRVTLDGMSTSHANIAEVDPSSGALTGDGDSILVQALAAGPLPFAVLPQGTGGDYTFTVEYIEDASVFSQGPDETEPNNNWQDANAIADGAAYRGQLDPDIDPADFVTVFVENASMVYVNLTVVGSCPYLCPEVFVLRSDHTPATDPDGVELSGDEIVFGARAATIWYFEVHVGDDVREYTVSVDVEPSPFEEGETLTYEQAAATGVIDMFIAGNDTTCPQYNFIFCGNGKLYGPSLLLYYTNLAPVSVNVLIPAGLRLDADDEGVSDYVTTRDTVVPMGAYASDEAAVIAAMERPGEAAPSWITFFEPIGMATGDEAKIIAETRTGNYSHPVEMAALWAGIGGQTRAGIADYGATTGTIDSAGQLLAAAGVDSDITPDPQAPPPGGNNNQTTGGGDTAGSGLGGFVLPAVVAIVLMGIAAAVVAGRRKRRAGAGQAPTYGTAQSAGSLPPGTPGTPPGGPPGPYGSIGAPQAYAPPPPIPPYYPPAPAVPAAPSMSACPSCNQPILVGVTTCPACHAGIAWD